MKNNFRISKISYLILSILVLSVIAQIGKFFLLKQTFEKLQREMQSIFYITSFLNLLVMVLIVVMGYKLFELMKDVFSNKKWSETLYKKIRLLGLLAISVLFVNSFLSLTERTSMDSSNLLGEPLMYFLSSFISTLFYNPLSWFFILSIFLFSDFLKYSYSLKADNESII